MCFWFAPLEIPVIFGIWIQPFISNLHGYVPKTPFFQFSFHNFCSFPAKKSWSLQEIPQILTQLEVIIVFQMLSFLLWVAVVIYNLGNNFSNFHFQFFPSYFKEVIIFPWSKICLWREVKENCSGAFFVGFFLDTRTSFFLHVFWFFNWEKKGWDRVYVSLPWARSFSQFRDNAKRPG